MQALANPLDAYEYTFGVGGMIDTASAVSVPRSAVAEADGFIGPTIGRSGYRTMGEFSDAVFERYQFFTDQAYSRVQARVAAGKIANDPM